MSKEILTKLLLFTTGGIVGSVVTWKLMKTKYEQYANEEIESMREYFANKKDIQKAGEAVVEGVQEGIEDKDELTVEQIREKVQELGYVNEQVMKQKQEQEEEEEDMIEPHVIAPEESWERDYPTITLTYYEGDGTLADDHNKIITNSEELVGEDFAEHFGEYEDYTVYVQNDNLKVIYEILKDFGTYEESLR